MRGCCGLFLDSQDFRFPCLRRHGGHPSRPDMSPQSASSTERLVIACGGTGGHLFPGIAVARAAKARGWETLILISEKQIDALATEGQSDLQFEKVPAVGMPRPLSLAMVKFLWRFLKTKRHCVK